MEFTAKTVKITAPSDIYHWGGCFAENGLFIILEVAGSIEEPAVIVGREVMELVLSGFADAPLRNFATLNSIIGTVKENKKATSFVIGFLNGEILYLGSVGEAEVMLMRQDKIGRLLAGNGTSSGKITCFDRILFSSKTFLGSFDEEKRRSLLKADEEKEEIPETSGAVALCIRILEKSSENRQRMIEKGLSKVSGIKNRILSVIKKENDDKWESEEEKKKKKVFFTIAIVLIFLLIMSIFLNISHSNSIKGREKLAKVMDLVSHQYDEADSLIDLNPERARSLLSDSKISLSELLSEFPKNSSEYKQVNDWLAKIAEKEVAAYKIYKLTGVPVFFDITLIKNGGSGERISGYKETKVILDGKNNVIYSLRTDTKKAEIIAGSEIAKDIKGISIHGNYAYLVNSSGVMKIDLESKQSQPVIKSDDKWGDIAGMEAFGGNIYLMDRKNNAVWKYIATETGFLSRQNYLNPDVRVNFSDAREFAIDGSVWVLFDNGFQKFTKGLGEDFAFKDFAEKLSNLSSFSTSDEDNNIYVLDKQSARILVFDKDGLYRAQYQWEGLKTAIDIVASEGEKKIFVLAGNKIYAIDIR